MPKASGRQESSLTLLPEDNVVLIIGNRYESAC